jgi:rhamnosyltransferase
VPEADTGRNEETRTVAMKIFPERSDRSGQARAAPARQRETEPAARRLAPVGGDVLAVVVSYNGLATTRETVLTLREQVGRVHIVDNGSDGPSLAILTELEDVPGVSVARQGDNRGIGQALNLGVARARELGCEWLLTMDQDSTIHPGMIDAFRAAVREHPEAVSLSPRVAGSRGRREEGVRVVGSAMTSGNLVRVSVYEQVGGYDEAFFIDGVDFEFCLRLRRAGHSIHRVPAAVMTHRLGVDRADLTRLGGFYAEHPPLRRYYMFRNFMYLAERYVRRFPFFILKLATAHAVLMLLIAFHDPRPLASYRGVFRGLVDYLARRDGAFRERGP